MSESTQRAAVITRVPVKLKEGLVKIAAQNRRSVGAEAQIALERHVAAEKEKTK